MKRGNLAKQNFGFTLIESLIAIFVLTVGIVGVLSAVPLAVQVAKFAQMTTVATQLGQAKIEEIVSKSFADISSEPEEKLSSPFEAYSREVEVTCFDPNENLFPNCPDTGIKKIKVTISWKSPLGVTTKKVEISTLIAQR